MNLQLSTRKINFVLAVVFGFLGQATLWITYELAKRGFVKTGLFETVILKWFLVVLFSVFCCLFFTSLVHSIFGFSFQTLNEKWNNLKGWQRGFLGVAFVIVACFIVLYPAIWFIDYFNHIGFRP